jgi:P pilus assembly chaperone PapD
LASISTSVTGPVVLTGTLNPLTVTNTGTVISTASGADGIDGATGTTWTVLNNGTITSASGTGVSLAGSGTVTSTGVVTGKYGIVLGSGSAWNSGSIGATAAAILIKGSGTVTNSGTLNAPSYGVELDAGGMVNNMNLISGGHNGIRVFGAAATVTNSGNITASVGDVIAFGSGGSVTNAAGGTITGQGSYGAAIYIAGAAGTVTNTGSITGVPYAVDLGQGGTVTNNAGGNISSKRGVNIQGSTGFVTNSGTISGSSAFGVRLNSGGQVTNLAGGSISGPLGVAIYSGAGTVTNDGTISGTHAVTFSGAGANRLVVGANAMFVGDIVGSTAAGATNTLELAGGTGTLSGLTAGSGSGTENGKTWAFSNFTSLAVDAGASWTMSGANTIASVQDNGTLSIAGSGRLTVTAALNPSTGLFSLGSGAVLDFANDVGSGAQIGFQGPSGVLELADIVNGSVRQFNATILGLVAGASTTVPTNAVNIQTAVTKATLSGSTITVLNNTATVATLQLGAAPVAGTVVMTQADATLGGYDVFLVNGNTSVPTVSWLPAAETGTEGTAIALGTIIPLGNTLASVTISGIPVGDTLSDGTHSFTAATGSTSVNVLGWNDGSLTIKPVNDANFSLSVQAQDSSGNTSTAANESVTVTPLAPTVAPGAVSGTAGQKIALDLGITTNSLAGDSNGLSSVTISGIPNGATLSNTNGDTLAISGGSISFSATQLAAGVLNGLAITTSGGGAFSLSIAAKAQDAQGDASATTTGAELLTVTGTTASGVPPYSHIVVVMEENHNYDEIIGNTSQAPYLNFLATNGASLTGYTAITHPSQPNYFALYAGSTFGTTDDNPYSEPDPTLATILAASGRSFVGYVEASGSDFNHDPWVSFPEGRSVQQDFSTFPTSNFASLPTVSFVIPGVSDDMHSGTIQQGDSWLQNNLSAYAQWALANNSLLIVTWDENDDDITPIEPSNQVAAIFYGADIAPGSYGGAYNHYNMLSTILAAYGLPGPNNAATAAPITGIFTTGTPVPTVTWSPGAETGVEGSVIALGTIAPSGNALTSVLVSGIPVGDTLSDGTHTFTAATGSTSANVLGWNYGALTLKASSDANFTLSAQATDASGNTSTTATEAVTVTPLAPAVASGAVSGTAGQKIALNLGITTNSLSGDSNSLSSVTISGIPSGATLSNTNGNTLTISGGGISFSAAQLAAGVLNGLAITLASAGSFSLTVAAVEQDAQGDLSATTTGTEPVTVNGLPTVTWLPGTETGVEGSAIALGTIAPSGGTLTSVLVSGIPVGDTLSDGTHTFTAATGSTSVNVLGWNYGALTIKASNDANFSLSVQAKDSSGNTSPVVNESVTVTPLAPAVVPGAVSGSAGQKIALNLGITSNSLSGDSNSLFSVTISGIPNGATLSNTKGDTLTVSGGSITFSAAQLAAGVLSGLAITPASSGTFALTVSAREQDAQGDLSATISANETVTATGTVGAGGTISTSITGPYVLSAATNPLTVTSTGKVTSTASGVDAIDGSSGTTWTINNSGTLSSSSGFGISLTGAGTITSNGLISGKTAIGVFGGGSITNNGSLSASAGIGGGGSVGSGVFTTGASSRVTNNGTITAGGYGVALDAGGTVTNTARITGGEDGIRIIGGIGTVINSGAIYSTVDDGLGIFNGGSVSNAAGAVIGNLGTKGAGIYITGAVGTVTNAGSISGIYYGIDIARGGSVTNFAGGIISSRKGVVIQGAAGSVTNSGTITGSSSPGIKLNAGGQVTNAASALISGSVGVAVYSAAGTVTNSGIVSGSSSAVTFAGSGANRVVLGATGAFKGNVVGSTKTGSTNTLELAGGTGTISGLSSGAGTVAANGSTWSFKNFTSLSEDAGGNWTLSGKNSIATIQNSGTLSIANSGSLTVTTAVDPASAGVFDLGSNSLLEIAANTGSGDQIAFLSASKIIIDKASSFGSNVGTANYTGPLIEAFGAGDSIDLKDVAFAGVGLNYTSSSGLLQVSSNGTGVASLLFQTSSLGSGTFHTANDGSAHTLITGS